MTSNAESIDEYNMTEKAPAPQWLTDYVGTYNILNAGNLHLLRNIYSDNAVFIDPLSRVEGLKALTEYFEHLYVNLTSCHFELTDYICDGNDAAIYWTMTVNHKKLKSGKSITLEGHSKLIQIDGKVTFQRDYFDAGAMIYENIPVVGGLVRFVKSKAGA
ncbi:nuclear transport factor 2 family protein [Psychrosphaera aestuarii]|uniref:nuclear transport factor 2 family protein n=1 Tax=Psychrosphaera aestuarii TaxID=1266052 RepID=UPI001FCFFBAE|nr:nuclear transport factor 2 family protein [Psychrosphaera aestuarii]